ncbi:hypothetical protein NCCP2145_13310 [Pseudarthrobacter sp. NCCP-2145]|nr:hypothetical protein NCCP2145_13310 [Pseudarthrobacter sp. NCCP-2145]
MAPVAQRCHAPEPCTGKMAVQAGHQLSGNKQVNIARRPHQVVLAPQQSPWQPGVVEFPEHRNQRRINLWNDACIIAVWIFAGKFRLRIGNRKLGGIRQFAHHFLIVWNLGARPLHAGRAPLIRWQSREPTPYLMGWHE